MSDWYSIRGILDDRRFMPGVRAFDEYVKAHRTHMPLFPEALEYLSHKPAVTAPWKGLRDYQKTDVEFITSRRGTLLAHQMRVGKTAPALASWMGMEPLNIVAPLPTRGVWLEWIERLHPGASVEVLTGRSYKRSRTKADIVFLHYDILPAWHSLGGVSPELVIFDECHVLSNAKALRSQAATALGARADRVVGLTGTPLWNKPEGLYTMLHTMHPGAWGSYRLFTQRYAGGTPGRYGWVTGGPTNVEEFQQRQSEFMRRLTWEDVLGHLPKITRSIEVVEVKKREARELDIELQSLRSEHGTTVGENAKLRRILGNLKSGVAGKLASNFVDANQSVVVWTWHKDVARSIAELVGRKTKTRTFLVTGDESQGVRDILLQEWKELGGCLVMTMIIGQVGLDLSKAHHAIFAEVDFTPAVVAQAEMRTFSPDVPMSATYLVADHEIDRLLIASIIAKVHMGNDMGMPVGETDLEFLTKTVSEEAPDLTAVVRGIV